MTFGSQLLGGYKIEGLRYLDSSESVKTKIKLTQRISHTVHMYLWSSNNPLDNRINYHRSGTKDTAN